MRRILLYSALAIAFVAIVAWLVLGANRGWTRTSVAIRTMDEVTGIEGIEYRHQFVPGMELLGGVLLGCACLAASAFLYRKPDHPIN